MDHPAARSIINAAKALGLFTGPQFRAHQTAALPIPSAAVGWTETMRALKRAEIAFAAELITRHPTLAHS